MFLKKTPTEEKISSEQKTSPVKIPVKVICSALIAVVSLALTAGMLSCLLGHVGPGGAGDHTEAGIMDKIDQFVTNDILVALGDKIDVERTFWLRDSDMVAPEPDPSAFGQTNDPTSLQWLLDDAAELLDGQELLFSTDTPIKKDTTVHYYLDETIFAITWKQVVYNCTYTFSEVKIAHPSQFRRFLSEGRYGSGVLHTTTEMAASVNAVVASAGDYYTYRTGGLVVYNNTLYRDTGYFSLDTCYVNDEGDLLFTQRGQLNDVDAVNAYLEENNVRFTLSFGPLMLKDGNYCVPAHYSLGEINDMYPRAALCQMDKLHYVVVTANMEDPYYARPTVSLFARSLQDMGIPTAYTLDGGQTATIVMNDQAINTISYGSEREISDILYFATAVPGNKSE